MQLGEKRHIQRRDKRLTVHRRLSRTETTSEGLGGASMAVDREFASTERHDGDVRRGIKRRNLKKGWSGI